MIYYIADLHFGCTNSYEGRTLEHDKLIIENWNKTVTNADDVYILGDIGRFGSSKDIEYLCQCISVLKGRKHLIVGNHDAVKDARITQLFTEICDYKKLIDNFNGLNYKVILSHYPILFYEGQHRGNVHLHGHLHNSDEQKLFTKLVKAMNKFFRNKTMKGAKDCPPARINNVGAMMPWMNYTPRTLKEILGGSYE